MDEPDALKIENKSDFTWVTLPDSINMDTYKTLEENIQARLDSGNVRVVLDLSKTNNLFSSGLGLIIRIRKWWRNPMVSSVLSMFPEKYARSSKRCTLTKYLPSTLPTWNSKFRRMRFLEKRMFGDKFTFVCVSRVENGMYRINLSGHMTVEQNLSVINDFKPDYKIMNHVFDLTGLDVIDSSGAHILMKLLMNINQHDGKSVAYGVNETVASLAEILGMNEFLHFCVDERSALQSVRKL